MRKIITHTHSFFSLFLVLQNSDFNPLVPELWGGLMTQFQKQKSLYHMYKLWVPLSDFVRSALCGLKNNMSYSIWIKLKWIDFFWLFLYKWFVLFFYILMLVDGGRVDMLHFYLAAIFFTLVTIHPTFAGPSELCLIWSILLPHH